MDLDASDFDEPWAPMRTLQERMGHRNIATTQRYADYAPRTREAELIAAAFGSPLDTPAAVAFPRGSD
jgi:integrase